MVDGGKVSQIPATVVYGEGNQAEKTVTQIGEFNTVSEGKYLTFVPETGKFEQLPASPTRRYWNRSPTLNRVAAASNPSSSTRPAA